MFLSEKRTLLAKELGHPVVFSVTLNFAENLRFSKSRFIVYFGAEERNLVSLAHIHNLRLTMTVSEILNEKI